MKNHGFEYVDSKNNVVDTTFMPRVHPKSVIKEPSLWTNYYRSDQHVLLPKNAVSLKATVIIANYSSVFVFSKREVKLDL